MVCTSCGQEAKKAWSFCPFCGQVLKRNKIESLFAPLFSRMKKPMQMNRTGFTIKINQSPGMPPQIQVTPVGRQVVQKTPHNCNPPKIIKEPASTVTEKPDILEIAIELPKVKKEHIHIHNNQNSIEIKARAGDVGYFKIINKPENSQLISQSYSKETLFLQFSHSQ